MGSETAEVVGIAAIDAVAAMAGVDGIGEIAETVFEGNGAIDIGSQVSDGGVAEIGGINALGKKSEGVKKVEVLSVVEETKCGFDFAAANAEPGLEAVIGEAPVEGGMVLAELSEIAIVTLRADMQLVGDLRAHVQAEIGEGPAAVQGVHGQPVVAAGIDESLGEEAVDLNGAVEEFEILGVERDGADGEACTDKKQPGYLSMHGISWDQKVRSVKWARNLNGRAMRRVER